MHVFGPLDRLGSEQQTVVLLPTKGWGPGGNQVTYANGIAPLRGADSAANPIATAYIMLADGEYITTISGRSSGLVDSVTIVTNVASYGPFGGTGGGGFSLGSQVYGFFGTVSTGSDGWLNGLGVYY
jgi:Jacalin-like lectin domain